MRFLSRFFAILVFASAAAGQFNDLATNIDGTRLYFSTSQRLRGTGVSFDRKIFRINETGLGLFLARDRGEPQGRTWSQFYDLAAPQVSSDASVVALTGVRACVGGSGCIAVERSQGTILDSGGNVVLSANGYVNLSPNGRYALFYGRNTLGFPGSATELVDLSSGQHTQLTFRIPGPVLRRVSNDATIAYADGTAARLWKAGAEETVAGVTLASPTDSLPLLLVSADARRLVYHSAAGLARYDRPTASVTVLADWNPAAVSITDDAETAAFIGNDGQAYLTPPLRRLTNEPEGIMEVLISGAGNRAFVVTGTGRLLLIDVPTGVLTELVPRTPNITTSLALAPGSLYALEGTGLSAQTLTPATPLPREAAGVRIRIGELDAALAYVSPELIWFQVPWEAPSQASRFQLLSGDSPFESGPGTVSVAALTPRAYHNAFEETKAVHENWSALVTADNPAHGGEIIHLYASGLGPVSPAGVTGEPAPSVPPAAITNPMTCRFWDGNPNESQLLYAGLAPTMIGIYQVSLRVPQNLRVTSASLECGIGSESLFASSIYVTP